MYLTPEEQLKKELCVAEHKMDSLCMVIVGVGYLVVMQHTVILGLLLALLTILYFYRMFFEEGR